MAANTNEKVRSAPGPAVITMKTSLLSRPGSNLFNALKSSIETNRKLRDVVKLQLIDIPEDVKDGPVAYERLVKGLRGADVLLAERSGGLNNIAKSLASYTCGSECSLKFVQFLYSGPNMFVDAVKQLELTPPTYPICRYGGTTGLHMAEFVLGNIIGRERRFHLAARNQKEHKWNRELLLNYRRLDKLTIGLIGLGDIGRTVAKACKSFGMTVWGVTRKPVTMETASPHVDQYRVLEGLNEMLPQCDYVCSALPSTPETVGLLTTEHFKLCSKKKAVFINIGRGDVTTTDAIATAVKCGWLGGAILDVHDVEPLPEDNPLWDLPGVTIFPHVSGWFSNEEISELVVDQLERLVSGESLAYKLDFEQGY